MSFKSFLGLSGLSYLSDFQALACRSHLLLSWKVAGKNKSENDMFNAAEIRCADTYFNILKYKYGHFASQINES